MAEAQLETTAAWRVGAVARLAGVTVRTMHHYDDIGLLAPSGRSESGYRHSAEVNVHRLTQTAVAIDPTGSSSMADE